MERLGARRKKNSILFILIALFGIVIFSLSAIQRIDEVSNRDRFLTEEYADYYIEKVSDYLIREEHLIANYLAHVQTDESGDARERALAELQELERQKYSFFRQNYVAPKGFALFQADSYHHTLLGYRAINGVLEHRYDEDQTIYEEHKKSFENFLDNAPSLKRRFEEAASVYEISKEKKIDMPADELESKLEKNSSK